MTQIRRSVYWVTPTLLCLWLYWLGLNAWFQQDDFAWLGLRLQVHDVPSFLEAMFAPMAQGTIRPWSERGFFLAFSTMFGLDPLPFRIWVFMTQFVNLALLCIVARALSRSAAVGLLAPVLWVVNSGLSISLSWTSAYNQILLSFFLLSGFYLFLRYTQTHARIYYLGQWVTFVLGFGALESNVVYPALVGAYCLCCAPKYFRKTLPMFAVSAGYTLLHTWAAPKERASGPYAIHLDSSVFATLWTYWQWALGPSRVEQFRAVPSWFGPFATFVLSVSLLGFIAWKLKKNIRGLLFSLAWFFIAILPVLPLRDHISDYYLVMPTIGLAILLAWAFVSAWRLGWISRLAATMLIATYIGSHLPVIRAVTRAYYENGRSARKVVMGVKRAHEIHPQSAILLAGVGNDLFWAAVYDNPFRILGGPEVYLVPGSRDHIRPLPGAADFEKWVLAGGPALRALDTDDWAAVYDASGDRLRCVTSSYARHAFRTLRPEPSQRIVLGSRLFSGQIGPEWHGIEDGYRWMPKRASVQLAQPPGAGRKLSVAGFCPANVLRAGPLRLAVRIDGMAAHSIDLATPDALFEFSFPLPDQAVGTVLPVELEVSRTTRLPGDRRELGVPIRMVEVR